MPIDANMREVFEKRAGLSPDQFAAVKRLKWLPLTLGKIRVDLARQREANPLMMAVTNTQDGHALYVYAAKGAFEVIWDARAEVGRVPLLVPSSVDGTELTLAGVSLPAPSWPLKQGDRIFVPMDEPAARRIAEQLLERAERDHPAFFAGIQRDFPTREAAIEDAMRSHLSSGEPQLINATAAHVGAPREAAAANKDEILEAAMSLAKLYVSLIQPWVEHRAKGDAAQIEAVWQAFKPKRHFSPTGDVGADEWFASQLKFEHHYLAETLRATAADGVEHRTKMLMAWVGVEFTIMGVAFTIGPMLVTQVERGEGATLEASVSWTYMWSGETHADGEVMRATIARDRAELEADFQHYVLTGRPAPKRG